MKKAQIQSGETITVMIIVMILLIIGLVFYSSYQGTSASEGRQREAQIDAMSLAIKAVNMEELKCTQTSTRIERCLDLYKIKASENIIQDNYENYFNTFANTNITLHFISEDKDPVSLYAYTGNFSSQSIPSYLPIIVNDPVEKKKIFAYLEVVALS